MLGLFHKCNILIELTPDWHCQEVQRALKGFGLAHVEVSFGLTVLGPEEERTNGKNICHYAAIYKTSWILILLVSEKSSLLLVL